MQVCRRASSVPFTSARGSEKILDGFDAQIMWFVGTSHRQVAYECFKAPAV